MMKFSRYKFFILGMKYFLWSWLPTTVFLWVNIFYVPRLDGDYAHQENMEYEMVKRACRICGYQAASHRQKRTVDMHCDSKKGRLSDTKKVVTCLLVTRRYLGRAISCTKLVSCTRLCV